MRNFKDYAEIRANTDIPRLEDFSYNEKPISKEEKNIGTEKIIDFASQLVFKKIEKIGANNRKFDKKRITFSIPVSISCYESEIDYILMRKDAQALFGEIEHEIIHFFASEWHINDHNHIESKKKQKTQVKSGFHNIAFSLDEAITEKINREIISENIDEIKKLIEEVKIYFDGIYEKRLVELKNNFELKEISVSKKIDSYHKKYKQKLKEILIEKDKTEIKYQKLLEESKAKEDEKNSFIKMKKESFEYEKEMARTLYNYQKNEEISLISPEYKKVVLDDLKKDYSFDDLLERDSYDYQIFILELLLDGVAYSLSTNEKEFKKNKEKVWKQLEKDYFYTNNFGLRIFDSVFGEGTLKKIKQLSIISLEKNTNFIEFVKNKNDEIKKKNFSPKK